MSRKKTISLKGKILQWLTVLNILATAGFTFYSYTSQKRLLLNAVDQQLESAAEAISLILPPDYHDTIFNKTKAEASYLRGMQLLTDYARRLNLNYLYTYIQNKDGQWLTASTSLSLKDVKENSIPADFYKQAGWKYDFGKRGSTVPVLLQPYAETAEFVEAVRTGKHVVSENRDEFGNWRTGCLAFLSPAGYWCVAGADVDVDFVKKALLETLIGCIAIGAAAFGFSFLVSVLISKAVSSDLVHLTEDFLRISKFDLIGGRLPHSKIREVSLLIDANNKVKSNLRSFGKYLPVELVRQLIETGSEAKLGGVKADLTLFFSDIADFTSVSEEMPPEVLVAHLGEYLSQLSDILMAEKGTVDKYMGDAIMAFWGAPIPMDAHAQMACRAAVNCQKRLRELEQKWSKDGRPEFRTRIGIHTGPVVLGNIGSDQRMNYTVIGDSVNLASRLESLNKYYGTTILVSDATEALVRDEFVTRPIDRVSVKGREQGLVIYELLGDKTSASEELKQLAEFWSQAFEQYSAKAWEEAVKVLEQAHAKFPSDKPTHLFLERCKAYQATPPPADWDGVHRMHEK